MTVIERLDAIRQISELKARYLRFADTQDWDGFRGVFTDDATLFFPETGQEAPAAIDDAMPVIRDFLEGVTSVHHGHMPEIEFQSDDRATGIWAMEDIVLWPPHRAAIVGQEAMHGYGHYHEEYVRQDGRWYIRTLKLTRLRLERRKPAISVA